MNEELHLSDAGAHLIQHFEGCKQKKGDQFVAYKCPAGVMTIGWGHTNHHGRKFDHNTHWTADDCHIVFKEDMEGFEKDVKRLVKVKLRQFQFDALVSFTYNCGAGALQKSTLLKKVNAGDFEAAAMEFHKWNKANGKVLAGLTRRRASESLLFQDITDDNYDGVADPIPPYYPMPQLVDEPA